MIENSELYALNPRWLSNVSTLLDRDMALDEIRAAVMRQREGTIPRTSESVAVIPVMGPLSFRDSWLSELFGGSSTKAIHGQVSAALADPTVRGLVLVVDSPGGAVYGLRELSDTMYRGRQKKPIMAVVDGMAASAALHIASAASELLVTPSGEVGSVGALMSHVDISELEKKVGVRTTLIHSGERKVHGHPLGPLSQADRIELQRRVDEAASDFRSALARNRGLSVSDVRARFGEGLLFRAKASVARGMADRIETLDSVLARATRLPSARDRGLRAVAQADRIVAGDVRLRARAALAIADSIVREGR